jgi:hypothetical protein
MRNIWLVVLLVLVLTGCGQSAGVSTPTESDTIPTEVTGSAPTPEVEIEVVELSIPDCGAGVTQLAGREELANYSGECTFLFEGTIPDDTSLDISYPEEFHQIWTLPVSMSDRLSASATGSFWVLALDEDVGIVANNFLTSKCAQTEGGLPNPAIMRYLDGDTIRGEERACP